MRPVQETAGDVLREWRQRKRMSQLDLALEADISSRHLSFVESGRSRASREVLMQLAERLVMPPRARNRLLLAGGYAPAYPEEALGPKMGEVFDAVVAVVDGHLPYPAIAVDRHWNLVRANSALEPLLKTCSPELLAPPINVLRLSLHPNGLGRIILNLAEWRHHVLERLRTQVDMSGDPQLADLYRELAALSAPEPPRTRQKVHGIAVPLQLQANEDRILNLITTTTVFGTATEVTLSELVIECFLPADAATRTYFAEQAKKLAVVDRSGCS